MKIGEKKDLDMNNVLIGRIKRIGIKRYGYQPRFYSARSKTWIGPFSDEADALKELVDHCDIERGILNQAFGSK